MNSLLTSLIEILFFAEIESSDLYDCNVHIALNAIKLAFKNNFLRMAKKRKKIENKMHAATNCHVHVTLYFTFGWPKFCTPCFDDILSISTVLQK